MKVRIHKKARIVGVYWKGLKCWDFFKILKTTDAVSEHTKTICSFESHFAKAITDVRDKYNDTNIPASGWRNRTIDSKKFTSKDELVNVMWHEEKRLTAGISESQ